MKRLFLITAFLLSSLVAFAGTPVKLMWEYEDYCSPWISRIPFQYLNGGYFLVWQGVWVTGAPYWTFGQNYSQTPGDTTHFYGQWSGAGYTYSEHSGTTKA